MTTTEAQPEEHEHARTPRPGQVQGRVALVTGGTRGLGAATCRSLAGEGAHVAAGYWRDDDEQDVEKFLTEMAADYPDQRITAHEGNIADSDDGRRLLQEVIDRHGRVDILVNNAGVTVDRTVAKMTDEEWHKVIAVNLSGAFFMAQAAARHMIERGTGRIISISSVVGETGNIGQVNYAASKSGLFGMTKSLAREVIFELNRAQRPAGDGIGLTVNAVTPGFIRTGMLDTIPDKVLDRLLTQIPVGRLGMPEEICPGGLLPGRRRLLLHHRADLGRQRRPGYVRGGSDGLPVAERRASPYGTDAVRLACGDARASGLGKGHPGGASRQAPRRAAHLGR